MSDRIPKEEIKQEEPTELDFTLEEEVIAIREALALISSMAASNIISSHNNPLTTPTGIVLFETKKEEVLRRLIAKRNGRDATPDHDTLAKSSRNA